MAEWKRVRLGEVCAVDYGTRIRKADSTGNEYPVYGGGGETFRWATFNRENQFVISRFAISEHCVRYVRGKFFLNDSGLTLKANENICCQRFLDYAMLSREAEIYNLADGSVQRNLNVEEFRKIAINLPPLSTQKRISAVLGAIDDKIETNRKICANLEAQAQALFKSWFVDFEPFGGKMPQEWKMGKLGDVAIYRQGKIAANDLTAETYYSTENMLPDKQGLMPATSLPQIGEVPACEKGDVLISNIRPYFKKICFSWSHGGHSPDVLCLAAKNDNMRYWLYRQLWDDAFFAYVMSSAKGTKMPRGDKDQILAYALAIPNENDVARFNAVIEPMCESIVSKGIESRSLAAMRDALLPRLMSGEIDVEKVEVA